MPCFAFVNLAKVFQRMDDEIIETQAKKQETIMENAVTPPSRQGVNMAEQMKSLAKLRLKRQVLKDPAMAAELVKTRATATYNANANLVQTAVSDLGTA